MVACFIVISDCHSSQACELACRYNHKLVKLAEAVLREVIDFEVAEARFQVWDRQWYLEGTAQGLRLGILYQLTAGCDTNLGQASPVLFLYQHHVLLQLCACHVWLVALLPTQIVATRDHLRCQEIAHNIYCDSLWYLSF